MYNNIIEYFTIRVFIIFFSTAASIGILMLALNIITIDEVVTILNLSPESASAFKAVFSRIQEVTSNILNIISQLLNKLFSWSGADVDLNKIKVDTNALDASKIEAPSK